MSEGLVGKKVLVTFVNWPINSATYVYEGFDEVGHYLRRADGVQRHFKFENVGNIEVVAEPEEPEVPEGDY